MSATNARPEPILKLNFSSHATLESKDLKASRKFFEEFLGFDVIQTSPISLMLRLGGDHIIAVVENKKKPEMPILNHNGIDVETQEEVNEAHELVQKHGPTWGVHKITKPALQHGTYSFFFWDADDNCWEILTNPKGGYTWLFEKGDLDGRGHLDKKFERPGMKQ